MERIYVIPLTTHSMPLLVVMGKTRTQIWNRGTEERHKPFVIYDPNSRPQFQSASGPKSTSMYELKSHHAASGAHFRFIVGWMKPTLDPHYCEFIYNHIRDFDQIVIFGGGIGRWNGVNNFMTWVDSQHPGFSRRITGVKRYRLRDYSEEEMRTIFRALS